MLHVTSNSNLPYSKMTSSNLAQEAELQKIKICLLGAQGVGKTSIVQQFVCNQFPDDYVPTERRRCYYPSVIINDHLYEVKIIDCPVIPYFPANSLCEWTDFRGYGLRTATAYVLVFDITNDETFQYVKMLREQIIESKGNSNHEVPIFVVGNKHDLSAANEDGKNNGHNHHKREVANLIKKQWKCAYVECSAKYNWHVVMIFKELMRAVDTNDFNAHKPTTTTRVQDAFRRNKCVIL